LDATIVNVALPHIQQALGFSGSGLEWVVNAYALAFGGLLLLAGRAGDLLGRRRVFIAGLLLFSAASLAGGFATSQAWLLAARAVQGPALRPSRRPHSR
jgi:MFS family permease